MELVEVICACHCIHYGCLVSDCNDLNCLYMCKTGVEPMETSPSSTSAPGEIPTSDVIVLEGHTSEVWTCPSVPALYIYLLCI